MDILYVLGKGSKWGNNELIFSLRSIAKFGKNVGRIYVVGHNPGFLSDKVTYISCKDSFKVKEKNILEKIIYAAKNSDIGDNFLLSSDDHFYVKETDFENYPYFRRGDLPSKVEKGDKAYKYHKCLVDTKEILEKAGYTSYFFAWHGNTHISKFAIQKAEEEGLIEASYNKCKEGCEPTCLILNILYKYIPFVITDRKDLKINDEIEGKQDLIKKIENRECFSIYDKSIYKGVEEYLRELFPKKCIYEK